MGVDTLEQEGKGFKEQFANRETLNGVETVDVSPATPSKKRDVMISPGWKFDVDVYEAWFKEFVGEGRRTIGFNNLNTDIETKFSDPEERSFIETFPEKTRQKVQTMLDVMKAKNITEIDVMGHSQGAAIAAITATILGRRAKKLGVPPPIRNIIFCGSTALVGKNNRARLGWGFLLDVLYGHDPYTPSLKAGSDWDKTSFKQNMIFGKRAGVTDADRELANAVKGTIPAYEAIRQTEESRANEAMAGDVLGDNVKENPMLAWEEIREMVEVRIEHLFRELRALGIGIVVMNGADDTVAQTERAGKTISALIRPEERTRKSAPEKTDEWKEKWSQDIDNFVNEIANGVVTIRTPHGYAWYPQVAGAAETIFTSLDKKQEKQNP